MESGKDRSSTAGIRTAGSVAALVVALLLPLVFAGPAAAAESSVTRVEPRGLKAGAVKIMGRVKVVGSVEPWRPGQEVRVFIYRDGRQIASRSLPVSRGDGSRGTFDTSLIAKRGSRYAVQARYYGESGEVAPSASARKSWRVRYSALRRGQCGPAVKGFRKALNRMAFVPGKSRCFNGRLQRAVRAYRKLNGLGRNARAGKGVVKRAFNLKGRYRVRKPGLGDHVEVPLSRQVLVFAKGKRPYAIFPISSGKTSTPTILGTYRFYRKDPGYNEIGMYYSSYFIRGYAIHGYKSVPNYPASNGCLRTFNADQPRIYEMTKIGMPIYTFGNAFAPYRAKRGLPNPADFDRLR